jgi:hypothetical protein
VSGTKEQNDGFCLDLINNTASAEVLPWLRSAGGIRTLGEMDSTAKSIELITDAFDAGAVQVFAVEIDSYGDDENTGKLCVELPNEPILRKRVLDWTGKIAEELGFEQELDVGQQYVFMMLD